MTPAMDGPETPEPVDARHHQRSRPYRSKRHRPCDVCRRRKQACCLDDKPPCRVCRELGTTCTFNEPPSKRQRGQGTRESLSHNAAAISGISVDDTDVDDVAGDNRRLATDVNDVSWSLGHTAAPGSVATASMLLAASPDCSRGNNSMLFLGGEDVATQQVPPMVPNLLQPSSHQDMWYLATLWDARSPVQRPLWMPPPPPVDGMGNNTVDYTQENTFQLSGEQTAAEISCDPRQGTPYRRQTQCCEIQRGTHNGHIDNNSHAHSNARDRGHTNSHRNSNSHPNGCSGEASPTQTVFSFEAQQPGYEAQYLGLAGDMDPYFMQHMRFGEDGVLDFGPFQYRRVSSSAAPGEIPAHFTLSRTKQLEHPSDRDGCLDELVSPNAGTRLVGLFLRYVFPGLPVLSRSRLKVRTVAIVPSEQCLSTLPPYLRAAVYASAYRFRRFDPVLNIAQVEKSTRDDDAAALWQMAHRGIQERLAAGATSLALVQAILIYLQRPINNQSSTMAADEPGHGPLLASAVHVAFQLGLHMDCTNWQSSSPPPSASSALLLPAWEIRLRRRLWWSLHAEVTWRSLLLGGTGGYVHLIPREQWDVAPLRAPDDFVIDHLVCPSEATAACAVADQIPCRLCHDGHDALFQASLSMCALDVYNELYTLAAARRCASRFDVSLEVCRRLLAQLRAWKKGLPKGMLGDEGPGEHNSQNSNHNSHHNSHHNSNHTSNGNSNCNSNQNDNQQRDYFHPGSATTLRLAALTVEVLIYRALLRPQSKGVGNRQEDEQGGQERESSASSASDQTGHTRPATSSSSSSSSQDSSPSPSVLAAFRGSIHVVQRVCSFTARLTAYDRNSLFCPAWARGSFAILSSFVLFLLVQAPTAALAQEVLALLSRWVIVLREQSVLFDDHMPLALLRLDSVFQMGMKQAFRLPPHARAAIQAEQPAPRYQQ